MKTLGIIIVLFCTFVLGFYLGGQKEVDYTLEVLSIDSIRVDNGQFKNDIKMSELQEYIIYDNR